VIKALEEIISRKSNNMERITKIVEYGEKLDIPVPFNWTVTAMIKALEQKKQNPVNQKEKR